jgi:AraC-like DNA-binding protein
MKNEQMLNKITDVANLNEILSNLLRNMGLDPNSMDLSNIQLKDMGFIKTYHLPQGLSLLAADLRLPQDFSFERSATAEPHFVLHLNEIVEPDFREDEEYMQSGKLMSEVKMCSDEFKINYIYPKNVHFKTVKLFLNSDVLTKTIGDAGIDSKINEYFSNAFEQSCKFIPVDASFRHLLEEILNYSQEQVLHNHYLYNRANLILERFFGKLIGTITHNPGKRLSSDEIARLRLVENILVKDITDTPPTIEQLSKVAAMSPTKLKQDFKNLYGHPIYEYFQKNRMHHARQMMQAGKVTVKEVGFKLGYSNISHFAKAFKKEFGVLPGSLK